MATTIRRVSPLTILDDIEPAKARCLALGFEPVGGVLDPEMAGFWAGKTSMIFATRATMAVDFPGTVIDELVGLTIAFIHVGSLDEALAALPSDASILARATTREATEEAIVRHGAEVFLLAETPGR